MDTDLLRECGIKTSSAIVDLIVLCVVLGSERLIRTTANSGAERRTPVYRSGPSIDLRIKTHEELQAIRNDRPSNCEARLQDPHVVLLLLIKLRSGINTG